jgi:hypothetical protein
MPTLRLEKSLDYPILAPKVGVTVGRAPSDVGSH